MNRTLIMTLLFFINFILKGQDTTQVQTSPVYHVNYSSTAIANNNTGNSSFVSSNNLKFNVAKDNVYVNTMNSWVYGSQTSGLTNNDFSLVLILIYFTSQANGITGELAPMRRVIL